MNISVNNKTLSDVLVLPIDGLSANAQEIIREVSEVYQCSRDIVLAAMFSAVGVAVGKKIRISDRFIAENKQYQALAALFFKKNSKETRCC